MALSLEGLDDFCADETGRAGDEYAHGGYVGWCYWILKLGFDEDCTKGI